MTRPSTISLLAALCTALLPGLGGCADLTGMARESCFSRSECIQGQQCTFGQCTWIPEFALDLEVTPLPSSGFLFQAVDDIDPTRSEPLRVIAAEPLHLILESPVEATARFTASAGLRRPRTFETVLQMATGESIARSEIQLMAGVRDGTSDALTPLRYDVMIEPVQSSCCGGRGPCAAPVRRQGLIPTADSTYVLPLDPATPPVILRGKVLVSESSWTPVENLQVQLFEPTTGVRSLATLTDKSGAFCLAVVPPPAGNTHQMVLRLGPSEVRPTLEIPGIVVGQPDLDLGVFFTGEHGTLIAITGNQIVGPDGAPVQGVQVSFAGLVVPDGEFRQTATTDELGRFTVRLLPGLYTALVVVPEEGTLASTELTGIEVSADPATSPTPLELVLRPRPQLSGQVIDGQTQAPVEGVEVIAEQIDPVDLALIGRTYRTSTDAEGAYNLPVDPGAYRLRFAPRPGSGLPWSVGHMVSEVTRDLALATVSLEAPVTFSGTVLGERRQATTEALGGASIELLGRTPDGRRTLVGAAWADEAGVFDAILPQSLAGGSDAPP